MTYSGNLREWWAGEKDGDQKKDGEKSDKRVEGLAGLRNGESDNRQL